MRTGGISGVATRAMAQPDAAEMAVIGSGRQALTQVAAVAAVRRLRRIRVYSPTEENRKAFVVRLGKLLPAMTVEESPSVRAAVAEAPIVTLVTRARTPFLSSDMLAKGAHLNAVGAITPEREEFEQAVFERVGSIAVDDVASVKSLSAEFRQRFGNDWSSVQPLSALIAAPTGRAKDADVTLFKAMGMGLSDLALGIEILKRVRAASGGRPIPQPQRATPRLVD
jgi:ornithine cyclodeaminase